MATEPQSPVTLPATSPEDRVTTTIAHDVAIVQVFAGQIALYGREGDMLIAISSSGVSPNILNAVSAKKRCGMKVIGLSEFSGGARHRSADISLHVPVGNDGVVEDAHQSIMHNIVRCTAARTDKSGCGKPLPMVVYATGNYLQYR